MGLVVEIQDSGVGPRERASFFDLRLSVHVSNTCFYKCYSHIPSSRPESREKCNYEASHHPNAKNPLQPT